MPSRILSESEIRKIAERYLKSVSIDPANAPDIREVITEAVRKIAPEREIDDTDVSEVITALSGRTVINDRIIAETAQRIVETSATEDLRLSVGQFLKQIKPSGYKITDKDIDGVISRGKLDPFTSTLPAIKKAVKDYFGSPRRVEEVPDDELRKLVRGELEKYGPVDAREVNELLRNFKASVDPEDQFSPDDIKKLVKARKPIQVQKPTAKEPEQPQPGPTATAIVRTQPPPQPETKEPTTPTEPQEPTTPTPPEPRSSNDDEETASGVTAGNYVPPKDQKKKTFFEIIRLKMQRYGLRPLTQQARNWLTDTIRKAARTPKQKEIFNRGRLEQTMAEAFVGRMFLYAYDAKWKKDLPFWDAFPLIFVVDLYDDGWLGINLHYLPMSLRIKLFDALLDLADDTTLDEITKLKLSYQYLKGFSQFSLVRPCLKRYLTHHVESSLLLIEPVDWEVAVFLPVEQFKKQSKERVWQDSRNKIKKIRGH